MMRDSLLALLALASLSLGPSARERIPIREVGIAFDTGKYAWKHEVTNQEYREFLASLDSAAQVAHSPDPSGWGVHSGLYLDHYHSHPAYDAHPVVNISIEDALRYCTWKTAEIRHRTGHTTAVVRLPTHAEWLWLAGFADYERRLQCAWGNTFHWGSNTIHDERGRALANVIIPMEYAVPTKRNRTHRSCEITCPVGNYPPNRSGLYDVHGNVREMVSDSSCTMGGGWMDRPKDCLPNQAKPYTGPSPALGFRPILVF